MTSNLYSLLSTFFAFLSIFLRTSTASPPVAGPLLPRPTNLRDSSFLTEATSNLTDIFDKAFKNAPITNYPPTNGSFSVALTSFSQHLTDSVLWDYHHLAANHNKQGTNASDGDSQYLIASISKVFSNLLLLKSNISLDAPVTDFLPELSGSKDSASTQYDEITVGMLGDHLGDGFPEIYQLIPLYQELGFPELPKTAFPECNVIGLNKACTIQELLTNLAKSPPVFAPNLSPAYGNTAFALLGLVLQRHTGRSFASLLRTEITEPLRMINTGPSPGNTSVAVIPQGSTSSWGSDFGLNTPQGGLYSSTNDLCKFMSTILSYKILPTEAAVRGWLKPLLMLQTENELVGRPWEIYRTTNLTSKNPHTIDIYAKDGGVVEYYSRMALIPEYGIGIICLTTGEVGILDAVMEASTSLIVEAVEEEARAQAMKLYAGSYATTSNDVPVDMNVTLDDGPGLLLTKLNRNGSDILDAIRTIFTNNLVVVSNLSTDWRLYPAGITRNATLDMYGGDVVLEDWRMGIEPVPFPANPNSILPSKEIYHSAVGSWQNLDSIYYGGRSVDHFVFVKKGGQVVGVEVPSLRANLRKG